MRTRGLRDAGGQTTGLHSVNDFKSISNITAIQITVATAAFKNKRPKQQAVTCLNFPSMDHLNVTEEKLQFVGLLKVFTREDTTQETVRHSAAETFTEQTEAVTRATWTGVTPRVQSEPHLQRGRPQGSEVNQPHLSQHPAERAHAETLTEEVRVGGTVGRACWCQRPTRFCCSSLTEATTESVSCSGSILDGSNFWFRTNLWKLSHFCFLQSFWPSCKIVSQANTRPQHPSEKS